ncbi:hypothetical protein C8R42DRAFT_715640 [Lentinula raphanica]|nr:hypothetical protein C8R42DRAFT_715640 [Lentinula raphanica]
MVVVGGLEEHIGKFVRRIHHFYKGSKTNANKWFKLVVVEFTGEVEVVTDLELELSPDDVEYVRETIFQVSSLLARIMTKTRRMAQISAANNAKTRAAKSKARNGNTRTQVMESVTIARTRSQKRNQQKQHSRRSPSVGSAAEPDGTEQHTHPDPPLDTAPASSSPKPVAELLSAAGAATSHLSPNPVPGSSAAPVAPHADSVSQIQMIREGWYLLKSYAEDEVTPDEVSDFLKLVKEPELDKAFANIMGCEPDEDSHRDALIEMVNSKIRVLEASTKVIPKKPQTTFRPAFARQDDSASRPPTTHAPPLPSNPGSPSAAAPSPPAAPSSPPAAPSSPPAAPSHLLPPSHPLSVSPPNAYVSQTGRAVASSIPPTSPSPMTLADVEHVPDLETVPAETRPGRSDPVVLKRRRKLLALAGKVSDRLSDETPVAGSSETHAKKKQKKKPVQKNRTDKGKQKALDKGKQRALTPVTEDEASDESQEEKGRKGRLSRAVKAEAFAIRQRYQEELEDLAKRSGKNLSTLLEVVGDVVPDNRSLNPWNAFQQYAVHPDGLGLCTGVNRNEVQLKDEILKRYNKLQKGEVEEGKLDLDGIMEWYWTEMAQETLEERTKGYTRKATERLCLPFINRSRQLYEAHQLCGIGWLIDPVSAVAVPWGADPLYIAMRDANPAQITAQAVDYGSMFHNQLMVQNESSVGLDPDKQALVNRFLEDGNNKVVLRGLLKDVLLWSLRERWFNSTSDLSSLNSSCIGETRPNKDFKQMKWGPAFADLCFQEKVKLVNYPADLKPIGPPDRITGAALVPVHHMKTIVKQYVQFWQQEAREKKAIAAKERNVASLFDEDEDEDVGDPNGRHKVFFEDLVRFVPWSDDEKQFSLKHQANIGILLQKPQGNDDPVVLTRVLHSKVFLKRAAARQIVIQLPKEMRKGGEESDREKTSDGDPKSCAEENESSEEDMVPQLGKANRVYQETGFHIGGYIVHPNAQPSIWVSTQALQDVKARNGTQMLTQAKDIAAQIAVTNMVSRQVDAALAALYGHCIVTSTIRARDRHILPIIIAYDIKRIFGDEADRLKIQMTNFVEQAWRAKIRIINWPVGLPYFRCGISTRNGYERGYKNVNDIKNDDLKRIVDPRREQIGRDMVKAQGKEVVAHGRTYFEVVQWSEDERKLPLKDLAKVGTILDEDGHIVAAVSHSQSYLRERKSPLSDTDDEEENDNQRKSKTPSDLFASPSPSPSAPPASLSPGPSAPRAKKHPPPPVNRKTRPT